MNVILACAVILLALAGPVACGGNQSVGGSATSDLATQQALMSRWNAAADAAGTSIDFHWAAFDQFPHPTFEGGSEQAYQDFAAVLLLFFQTADNFGFLAQHHLFQSSLRYVFPSGQVGIDTSFQQLATDFSSSTGFGNISAATQQALRSFLDRMTP